MVVGIDLPRQQDVALERSYPIFLMDLFSQFFDGGRKEKAHRIVFFLERKMYVQFLCFSMMSCALGTHLYIV